MTGKEKLSLISESSSNYGSSGMHLKTYTAGEDGSRLAEMAKEFGLAHQRLPRNQVRARVNAPLSVLSKRLMGRLPSWKEDAAVEIMEAEDPHAHGLGGDMTSAIMGIIKGMVGPAILYLPHGFAKAGYLASIPILMLATILFLCSSASLLDSWKHENLKEKRSSNPSRIILSYPYRALGSKGETVVKIGIALMQSGVCLTYVIFVSQYLKACANIIWDLDIPTWYSDQSPIYFCSWERL